MSRCYTQITLADRRRLHHLMAADKNGYAKRARGQERRKDYMSDPAVIAQRKKALSRLDAAE